MSMATATAAAARPKLARPAPAGTGGGVTAGWLGMPTATEVLKEPEGTEDGDGFAEVKEPEGAGDGTIGGSVGLTGLTKVVVPGLTGLTKVVVPGLTGLTKVVVPGLTGFTKVVVGLTGSVVVETAKVSVMHVVVCDCTGHPGLPGGHWVRVRVRVV